MKITNNFNLSELINSKTAANKGFHEQFDPPQDVIDNLVLLTKKVLQPIRDVLKVSIRVSSGYRCERLNKSIGGSTKSQHAKGQAADLNNTSGSDIEIAKAVVNNNIDFDQMIIEFGTLKNPSWIHISYKKVGNRGQILRAEKLNGRTKYRFLTSKDIQEI